MFLLFILGLLTSLSLGQTDYQYDDAEFIEDQELTDIVPPAPQPAVRPVFDLYKKFSVSRRGEWTKEKAKKTDDENCYNYFKLLNRKGVSSRKNKKYLKKMRDIYSGGRIVLHHAMHSPDEPTDGIIKFHRSKGWGDVGYHFLIDQKDCKIKEGRPLHKVPIAAGHMPSRVGDCLRDKAKYDKNAKYDISKDFDYKSVNIAWTGNANTKDPGQACKNKIGDFMAGLAKVLNINKVGGHGHYNHFKHDCPGAHLSEFLENFPKKHGLMVEGSGKLLSGKNIYDIVLAANNNPKEDREDWEWPKKTDMQAYYANEIPLGEATAKIERGEKFPKNTLIINDSSTQPIYCGKCKGKRKKFRKKGIRWTRRK